MSLPFRTWTPLSLWIYIRTHPINLSSPILSLNQVLSNIKEKKFLSAIATEIGNVINILRNDILDSSFDFKSNDLMFHEQNLYF
jgi:hypothetical protein